LTRVVVSTPEEFHRIWNKAQGSQQVGRSIIHDATSRTHAIVDLELVKAEILTLEQRIEDKHDA
jgi:hypothetical protein